MKLEDLFKILIRRKWVILATMVVTLAVVSAGTFLATPLYSTTTSLRIATAATGMMNYQDYMYADRLINTYINIATTKPVLDELQQRLGLTESPSVQVESVSDTELIQIHVEDASPHMAASIANTLADILINQSTDLYTGGGKSSLDILGEQLTRMEDEVKEARKYYLSQVSREGIDPQSIQAAKQAMDLKQEIYASTLEEYEQTRLREALRSKSISIVEPATAPSSPSKPNKILNIGLGLMVGLAAGLGLAFLFENLDSTIYSVEQIEDLTKLPNLGSVPDSIIRKRFVSTNGSNPYTEAFRRIRTIIWSREADQPINALMITSPEPGEGKSTIVSDLAFVLAQSGHKVVVVDGDMRLPNQHKLFNLPNDRGLSNVLAQEINLDEALQQTEMPGLRVLTSGPIPGNPSELLGTYLMSEVIDQLRERFHIVLVDTPALLQVTDGIVIAPQVDGVVLVVCRANSRRQDVVSAIKQLKEINANMIGFIANRSGQNIGYYYYHRPRRPLLKKIL